MENSELISSGIGAGIGFVLAQLVNAAKLLRDWWIRPRLVIEPPEDNCKILSHTAEVDRGAYLDEEIYGFSVRNHGRSLATGVRIQLIKIECAQRGPQPGFETISEQAYDLAFYKGAGYTSKDTEAVLVPRASVLVELAGWRQDYFAVFPAVSGLPDYYDEMCGGATKYRFTVVAFDDKARFVRKALTVTN